MRRTRGIVLRLSLADLFHEWILSVCLVMAVAAVLSPLLILFGLKFGTIEIMRDRLIEDPRNREIRPMVSRSFERDWFESMAGRLDVDFVVPFTRQISAQVDARLVSGGESLSLDILPTDQGDPLLLQNGAEVPGEMECVLSSSASEELGASPGDMLAVRVKRLRGSDYETADVRLRVTGVTRARATMLRSMYVPLPFLEAVERFKDGQAVPEYGWPGEQALAYPVYDHLVVLLREPLPRVDSFRLVNNTGFTRKEELDPQALAERVGWEAAASGSAYLVSSRTKPVDAESLLAVQYALRGRGAVLVPGVRDLEAVLLAPDGGEVARLGLDAFSMTAEDAESWGVAVHPGWHRVAEDAPASMWRKVLLPPELAEQYAPAQEGPEAADPLRLRLEREDGTVLEFPVRVQPGANPVSGRALIPVRLAGVLNLFGERNVGFEPRSGEFTLERRGYAGFRLYAATIDHVDGLRRELESRGVTVSTEAERIRDVMELDGYLTLIFMLIAGVALAGGAASLTASLYASVERKRRDLSVLRLLGLSGPTLFRFPIYQGSLIASAGFGVAFGFFEMLAVVINTLFRDHLQAEESLCRLEPWHLASALAGTVLVAVLAGSVAAWRATRIEPAEALRDE